MHPSIRLSDRGINAVNSEADKAEEFNRRRTTNQNQELFIAGVERARR